MTTPRITAQVSRATTLVKRLNNIIDTNRSVFTAGKTFTQSWLMNTYGIAPMAMNPSPKDVARFNLKLVTAYTKLNKLLAKRGLYVKSTNYYETFEVLTLEKAISKVKKYKNKAKGDKAASRNLDKGIKNFKSKWTKKLSKDEINEVASYIDKSCI